MKCLIELLTEWRQRRRVRRMLAARVAAYREAFRESPDLVRACKLRQRSLDNWCAGHHRESLYRWPKEEDGK